MTPLNKYPKAKMLEDFQPKTIGQYQFINKKAETLAQDFLVGKKLWKNKAFTRFIVN